MKSHRIIASVMAALMASTSPAAFAEAGHYSAAISLPAPIHVPIGGGIIDRIKDGLKGTILAFATVYTNAGTAIINNRVIQAGTAPKDIGWGIGTTAAAVTDTALVSESAPTTAGGRTVGTESRTTITVTNDNYQVQGTVTAGSTLAITEMGLFDAVTSGNMLMRSVFAAVNVVSGDSIAGTFGLQQIAG